MRGGISTGAEKRTAGGGKETSGLAGSLGATCNGTARTPDAIRFSWSETRLRYEALPRAPQNVRADGYNDQGVKCQAA